MDDSALPFREITKLEDRHRIFVRKEPAVAKIQKTEGWLSWILSRVFYRKPITYPPERVESFLQQIHFVTIRDSKVAEIQKLMPGIQVVICCHQTSHFGKDRRSSAHFSFSHLQSIQKTKNSLLD